MSDIVNQPFIIIGASQPASVTAPDDYCSAIGYKEVDFCHIRSYLSRSQAFGCCLPIATFFGLGSNCGKGLFPIPTDAGLPVSLPRLPLGYHYPQTSTDRTNGRRAGAGVFAKERGKIYVAPWIQSTETVIVKWDGIKRAYTDADPLDDDPLLKQAVREYVRWQHADKFDKDEAEMLRAKIAYEDARAMLIRQCREETRIRGCEPSLARSSPAGLISIYYNDEQSASATCPDGTTGTPVTVTIPAGTIGSNVSVADANQKAKDEAKSQAESRLDCSTPEATFTNDAQTATASCQGEDGAPPPEGQPVTVTIPAGTVESTISKADANALALALAQEQASGELACTFWNAEQTYTASCDTGIGADVTKTVGSHTYSSTLSQADADAQALNDAKTQAESALSCSGGSGTFLNTPQTVTASYTCLIHNGAQRCTVNVTCNIPANVVSSNVSQSDANVQAVNKGRAKAQQMAQNNCLQGHCGNFTTTFP